MVQFSHTHPPPPQKKIHVINKIIIIYDFANFSKYWWFLVMHNIIRIYTTLLTKPIKLIFIILSYLPKLYFGWKKKNLHTLLRKLYMQTTCNLRVLFYIYPFDFNRNFENFINIFFLWPYWRFCHWQYY